MSLAISMDLSKSETKTYEANFAVDLEGLDPKLKKILINLFSKTSSVQQENEELKSLLDEQVSSLKREVKTLKDKIQPAQDLAVGGTGIAGFSVSFMLLKYLGLTTLFSASVSSFAGFGSGYLAYEWIKYKSTV